LPVFGIPRQLRPYFDDRTRAGAKRHADPDWRIQYLRTVSYAWFAVGFFAVIVLVFLDATGNAIGGKSGRADGDAIGGALMAFCLAGAAYSTWKTIIALLARRASRRYGTRSERYRRLAARAALRNSSLVGQAVAAVVVFALVLAVA